MLTSQLRSEANFCLTCFRTFFVKVVPLALFHFFQNLLVIQFRKIYWNLYLFALLFDMVTRIVTYLIVFVVLVGKERVSNWIVPVMFY